MVDKAIPRQSVGRIAARHHRVSWRAAVLLFHEKRRDDSVPTVYRRKTILRAPIVLYRVIAGITAYGGEGSEQRKPILDDDLGRE
jgi:hypothetical protein